MEKMLTSDIKSGDKVILSDGLGADVITVKGAGREVASLIVRIYGIAATNRRVFPEDVCKIIPMPSP